MPIASAYQLRQDILLLQWQLQLAQVSQEHVEAFGGRYTLDLVTDRDLQHIERQR